MRISVISSMLKSLDVASASGSSAETDLAVQLSAWVSSADS